MARLPQLRDAGRERMLGLRGTEALDHRGQARGEPVAPRRADVANALGRSFAGIWDLPVDGKTVPVIAVLDTDPGAEEAARRLVPRPDLRVIKVAKNHDTLKARYDAAVAATAKISVEIAVSLVEPANTVQMKVASFTELTADDRKILTGLQELGVDVAQGLIETHPVYADPGESGVRYFADGGSAGWAACTSGFPVAHNGGTFNLTAAHCFEGGPWGMPVYKSTGDAVSSDLGGHYGSAAAWVAPGRPTSACTPRQPPRRRVHRPVVLPAGHGRSRSCPSGAGLLLPRRHHGS